MMTLKKQLKNTIGRKATRRIYKAAPWVGAAVALGVGGAAVSRSGSLEKVREKARGITPRRSDG